MSESVTRLREIVARLRSPAGCPWDREQTHASLRGALLEECHEVLDAINRSDDANLREELGDLLLQVVMHAQMGAERGAFVFEDVAAEICDKLVRRHPHVFGDASANDSGEVLRQWEQIKMAEKGGGDASVLDGVPKTLPALALARKIQSKAARVGFDWPEAEGALAKLREELEEFERELAGGDARRIEEEAGDVLFSMVNVLRKLGVDAEAALAAAATKFTRRFQSMEGELRGNGKRLEDCGLEEMDAVWERHKASGS